MKRLAKTAWVIVSIIACVHCGASDESGSSGGGGRGGSGTGGSGASTSGGGSGGSSGGDGGSPCEGIEFASAATDWPIPYDATGLSSPYHTVVDLTGDGLPDFVEHLWEEGGTNPGVGVSHWRLFANTCAP